MTNKQIHNQMMGRILGAFIVLAILWLVSASHLQSRYKEAMIWFLLGFLLCMVWTFICSEAALNAEHRAEQERVRVSTSKGPVELAVTDISQVLDLVKSAISRRERLLIFHDVDTKLWLDNEVWARLAEMGFTVQVRNGVDRHGAEVTISWTADTVVM